MPVRTILLLVLSLAAVAVGASEPNGPNSPASQLQFEMSTLTPEWVVTAEVEDEQVTYTDPGSIRPQYMARIILPREGHRMIDSARQAEAMAMGSPLAEKLSEAQREFLAQGFGTWLDTSAANVPKHYSVNFYAVSEEDARIMARALLDYFAENARRSIGFDRDRLAEAKRLLQESQATLPEKQKQLERVQQRYEQAKESTYPLNTDQEASQLAKDLVLQMDRQVKTLDIDLAGVRGKLEVINEYLSRPDLSKEAIETLEGQRIDQMIEMSGLEARRRAIRQVRDEQQRFWDLFRQRRDLQNAIELLELDIERNEDRTRNLTYRLEHPFGDMVVPPVYQNKVILYAIRAKDSQDG